MALREPQGPPFDAAGAATGCVRDSIYLVMLSLTQHLYKLKCQLLQDSRVKPENDIIAKFGNDIIAKFGMTVDFLPG